MKTRFCSMLITVGGLALLLISGAAAQNAPLNLEPVSPPTPPTVEFAPPNHIPYDPYQRLDTLPEYPYNGLQPIRTQAQPMPAKPAGIDLDVTYIGRSPMYKRYEVWYTSDGKPYLRPGTENDQRWPAPGELVTFTAHVMNKGTVASGSFAFKWFIDGVEVRGGVHSSLAPGGEATEAYQWAWAHTMDGERILGAHTIRFAADPGNLISETCESNNSLEDRTDALSLVLAVTPELYAALETPVDPKWPFSAEDWLQKQIAAMNAAFVRSVYPSAPNGIIERVRLEKILVTSASPPADLAVDGGFHMAIDDRYGNAYYDPTTDVSGALIHELAHQLGIIDLYSFSFEIHAVRVTDRDGQRVEMESALPSTGLMLNPGIQPPVFEEHTTLGINSNKGYRRGYFGEYLYDVPSESYVRVLDSRGLPASGVTIKLYRGRAAPPEIPNGAYAKQFDDSPEITATTDAEGVAALQNRAVGALVSTHTNHTLRDNPFDIIDVGGNTNSFILELAKGTHQEFGWVEITRFNLAAWQGNSQSVTFEIRTHIPTDVVPIAPVLSSKIEVGRVNLRWTASPSSGVTGYNVYRTLSRPGFSYAQIATGITGLEYSEPYDYGAHAVTYVVTAVDARGQESGFSNFVNTFRVINPSSIALDELGRRIILDPQNGYAVLRQSPSGVFQDALGSSFYHLEYSQYLARDILGRFIISHPGDQYTSRQSIRMTDQEVTPLLEFGEQGSGPTQLQTPAGVVAWGQPCTIEGPLSVDSHSLLLLHFDGSYTGMQGQPGTASGTTFAPGRYSEGVLVDSNDMLTYGTAGNLNRTQGALEFWIRPSWDGNDGKSYAFFEVGQNWFNRMRITKDGANNLRFMLWDSSKEYGVGYNIAHWRAGEWHHIGVTWAGTQLAIYVDGQQRESTNSAGLPDSLTAVLSIGSSMGRDQQANAVIDEFRISDIPRIGNSDSCSYRIVVADSGNNRVQAFDDKGNFVTAFGGPGTGPGQFNNPQGLTIDSNGRVLVADSGNNRLQTLNFDGTTFGFVRSIFANLNGPTGVATYGNDRILVADTGNNKIKILNATGSLLAEYTAPNDEYSGAFNRPRGVIGDLTGNIVVADTGNRRVVTIRGVLPTQTPTPTMTPTPTPTVTPTAVRGSISGIVWLDRNGNGVRETEEPLLAGALVGLYANGTQVGSVTTQSDGAYGFASLLAGSYYLQEINPPEARFSSTPDEMSIVLAEGQHVSGDFGDWNGFATWLPLLLRGQ
jgi:hypothetical protein